MASLPSTLADPFARLLPRSAPARSTLGYAAWTAICFLFFLALTFPHELVVRRYANEVASESGWRLRFDGATLRPWSGYRLARLEALPPGGGTDPALSATELRIHPSWLLLLGRGPFPVLFSGEAYGGTFSGSFDRAAGLHLEWAGLQLGKYPRLGELVEGGWSGELSGEVRAAAQGDWKTLRGRGRLALRDAALLHGRAAGFVIPDLHFASGDCEFEIKNGRVDVRSLKLSGTEIDADLRGQVFVASPPIVSATASVKPLPGAPPGLEALLSILNGGTRPRGGAYSFTLYGPLSAPRLR